MAEVFRAKAFGVEGFERLLAVKRILPNIAEDQDFIEMFVDEAKIAVQLNHANIAQVFDLGNEQGSYYIAMEHIHGRDLRAIFDRMRNQGEPMPVSQACFVTMKVCEGLDYAHNKRDQGGRDLNLVHRDVSPQNIIVSFDGEVKLIDFGIAKAAGKASNTQAGILKGKFGYMSPEQVRGLPVDRRSDVFSCGIVLYELLTGERLFVGESDFSTLEKVRNVEILPPSTYNRRIQPELERIVLKALAKDVEDRYQNAIDLHDELQAFVYTAGEFYSRKDLSGWMKQVWAKEIKEESAKIASYRDMAPPVPTEAPQTLQGTPARKTTPPPIPGRHPGGKPPTAQPMTASGSPGLEWDDDELETAIYDDEPTGQSNPAVTSRSAPTVPALAGSALAASSTSAGEEPDLSSLVSSAGWEASKTPEDVAPERVADGSGRTKSPFDDAPIATATEQEGEASAVLRLASLAATDVPEGEPITPTLAPTVVAEPRRKTLYALIAASLAVTAAIVAVVVVVTGGRSSETKAVASPIAEEAEAAVAGVTHADTGFDLIVDPAGVRVSLDGRPIGKAPLQIRSLNEGDHYIEIEAPGGFFSKHETHTVVRGVAERVVIKLDAMDITGTFKAEPAGTTVMLISDGISQDLGLAPAEHVLDPRKRYEVLFKKDGYLSVTKPLEITSNPQVRVSAILERGRTARSSTARVAAVTRPEPVSVAPVTLPEVTAPKKEEPAPKKDVVKTTAPAVGTLLLGAKPACQIFIDGRDTGKKTPQRNLSLAVGQHRITLLNNEFGIKESFTVKIKSGEATKSIKNFMDQVN